VTTKTLTVTAEELLHMPRGHHRYELIHGVLNKMPPAGHYHGKQVVRVTAPLAVHVRSNDLGSVYAAETGYKLASDPDHVRAPDVSYVSRERLELMGETEGYWPGAPDLAVEVISPSDRYADVEEKVSEWLNAGAHMVIVVNPRSRTVRVHRSHTETIDLTENDVLDGDDVVPGWRLPVTDIFD
jgi:Uma2 family endonuclease